ncbi:MAG: hypothetical protein H6581_09280 [Bacteroidia bacterium]|nr:hypothetical protein [Bacteroidia bacterium]
MEENLPPENLDRVITANCEACGSKMVWDPKLQQLACEHCGNTRFLSGDSDQVQEQDFNEALRMEGQPRGFGTPTRIFHCNSCGAETAVGPETASFSCPFCSSPNVNEGAIADKVIQPSGIIPFKIRKQEALDKFKEWIKKGWFHPGDLKKIASLEKIAGVYVPFWTYDAMTYSNWTAEAGYHYYTTETYTDKDGNTQTRQVQHTRWVPASGYFEHFFDDVLVVGSNGIEQNMVERVYPFELKEVVNFDSQYILGWNSEVYQKDVKEGFQVAESKMDDYIRQACSQQVPGDTQRNLRVSTRKHNITFKHILLPMWVAGYQYKNKVFQFLVNGQTGKSGGSKPISAIKVILLILLIIAIGVGIYFLTQSGQPAPQPQ